MPLYRLLDRLSGLLLAVFIVWGPWSFGCTTPWAIQVQNALGYCLGGCLLFKLLLRRTHYPAWSARSLRRDGLDVALAVLTGAILLFVLVSAVNARMSMTPGSWKLVYYPALSWLPHSFDASSTWRVFSLYLALAAFFWSVRDWVLYPPPGRDHANASAEHPWLPRRVRILLWILCVNGALLAIQSIAQRLSGTGQLLWLLTPRINKDPVSFFGPYAYRANAAQYFNLVWPVALGFWWSCRRAARRHHRSSDPEAPAAPRRHNGHWLLSCLLLMAVCPIVSTSRGGAIIMAGLVVVALGILGMALWQSSWLSKMTLLLALGGMVTLGVLLGWEELGPRMEMLQQGYEQRETMFDTGRRMAADAPLYGTGPGTFSPLFQFYRRSSQEYWPAQMHNDWLETRITFGWVGMGLVLAALAVAVGRWFVPGRLRGEKNFVLLTWCALGGCLLHARFDFPFQIPSILALFLFMCALLSCLAKSLRQTGGRD